MLVYLWHRAYPPIVTFARVYGKKKEKNNPYPYVCAQLSITVQKLQTAWNLSKLHIENIAGWHHCSCVNNNAGVNRFLTRYEGCQCERCMTVTYETKLLICKKEECCVGIDYAMKLNKIVIPCLPSIQLYCCNVVCYIVNHRVYEFTKNILMKFYFALIIYKKIMLSH